MTARDFCYWLQGYFEISGPTVGTDVLNAAQIGIIERHLALVFAHDIDPKAGPPAVQKALDAIHKPLCSSDVQVRC